MTILIVDDAQTVRSYHRQLLEDEGFQVAEACNGLEGLEYLNQHGTEVQALLLDINMPQMDGYSLLRELRRHPEQYGKPVIMISTEAEQQDRELAFRTGANGYFIKPVSPRELARSVRLITGTPLTNPTSAEEE